MKKNIKTTCTMAMLAFASIASAQQPEGVGLGVIVGEPTGITLKKWVSPTQALDAAAGWSFSDYDSFHFHADYLFHRFGIWGEEPASGRLPLYFGVGGRLKLRDHNHHHNHDHDDDLLGIRFPIGIAYLVQETPLEFFAEIVPILDLAPDTDAELNAALGVRYYFN